MNNCSAHLAFVLWLASTGVCHAGPQDEYERPVIDPAELRYYIGPRIRYAVVPSFMLSGVYAEHADIGNLSFGLEFQRRRIGAFDLVIGVDYTDLSSDPGFWRRAGDPDISSNYTENGLRMIGADTSFYWNRAINPNFGVFGGVGLGIGLIVGEVKTSEPCINDDGTADLSRKCPDVETSQAEIPSALPVLNLVGGLRMSFDSFTSKLELGFRDAFFFGVGFGYEWGARSKAEPAAKSR